MTIGETIEQEVNRYKSACAEGNTKEAMLLEYVALLNEIKATRILEGINEVKKAYLDLNQGR